MMQPQQGPLPGTAAPPMQAPAQAPMAGGAAPPYRQLKVEDALAYLDQVKMKFEDKPEIYNQFLDIMKEFKAQSIDTPGVIERVLQLFHGHRMLILGFNTFLPPGYKIEFSDDQDKPRVQLKYPQGMTGPQPQPYVPPPASALPVQQAPNHLPGMAPAPYDETAEMTFEQKAQLAVGLERLSSNNIVEAVKLIREIMPTLGAGQEEIEIDINALDNRTLWKLWNFVETCKAVKKRPPKRAAETADSRARAITQAQGHIAQQLTQVDDGLRAYEQPSGPQGIALQQQDDNDSPADSESDSDDDGPSLPTPANANGGGSSNWQDFQNARKQREQEQQERNAQAARANERAQFRAPPPAAAARHRRTDAHRRPPTPATVHRCTLPTAAHRRPPPLTAAHRRARRARRARRPPTATHAARRRPHSPPPPVPPTTTQP